MKKRFTQMIALLAMLFLPFALFAQYEDPAYGIRIDESFEKGIPADWTQENVSGSINWVAESQNLTYPNTAYDSLGRVAFRNTTGVTTKAITRLILPAVDVSSLFQPILVFSHAQDKWSGDFDSLRVVCRTSADGEWKTLTVFENYIAKWQTDTIFLPSSAYCQVAFEATDNLGRGVVIDDVIIRSTPSCFKPEDLYTSNVTNNSIVVNWMGSFDAEYFYVKLSKTPLTEEELASSSTKLVCDTTTDGVSLQFEGLERGVKYYYYVRSQCEHEISDWASGEFKTANIINIPAYLDFNLPEEDLIPYEDEPYYMEGWYYAASDSDYIPYGDAQILDWDEDGWKSYVSIDSSSVLVFSYTDGWYCSYMGGLPVNAWAYIATPEVTVDVKDLQISFESMNYYNYEAEISSIIVGVMDDPQDRSTFVPIQTITNKRRFIYNEYVVSFEKYTGKGRYIAFMSDFGKTNHFTIENLAIEPRKDVPATPLFDIMMPTASAMQFKFEQNYDSYEVVLSNTKYDIDRGKDFPDSLAVISKHTIANMDSIGNLKPDARYYVYVRGVKGGKKSNWTYPRYEEMPSRLDVREYPYFFDFGRLPVSVPDMNGYVEPWTEYEIPTNIKPLYTYTYNSMYLADSASWVPQNYLIASPISSRDLVISCYYPYDATTIAVFPEADLSQTKVSFYGVGRLTSRSSNPATNLANYKFKAAVGIMSDANDINSFTPIDTIEPSYLEYTYYEYDLSAYPEIQGKFFAIKVADFDFTYSSQTGYTNRIHVTNVQYEKSFDCKTPTNVDAEVDPYDPSKVTISWVANGVTEWNVRVAETEYNKDQFITGGDFEFVYDAKVTSPKVEITGLEYPYHKYYYWIQPVCSGVNGEWTVARNFETFCPLVYSLPYTQNFDDAEAGSNVWTGFSADCMFTKQWTRSIPGTSSSYKNKYYYPYVTNTYAYNGENSLPLFKKYASTSRNYVALPEFNKPIDSLQISFRLYSLQTSAIYWKTQEIAVGVMTDPLDIKTFEQVATVVPTKAKTWERISIKLDEYVGKGKYIAIRETDKFTRSPGNSTKYAEGVNTDSVYIDNITVNVAAPCETPYDVFASDVTPNAATINWSSDAKSFIVIVTEEPLAYADLIDYDDYKEGLKPDYDYEDAIVSVDTVVGARNVRVNGLSINQEYYVYVKGLCQGMYTDYAIDYTFTTFCPALPAEDLFGNFSDVTAGKLPDCWFFGKTIGEYTGTNTILNYISVKAAGTSSSISSAIKAQGNSLYLSSTNGAVNSSTGKPNVNGTYVITPSLDIDKITNYKVKFKAWTSPSYMYTNCGTNDYARSLLVGVVTNPYDMSTFMPIDTIENIHRDPYPYEVYLDKYQFDLNGDTGKFVAFYSNFSIRNNIYLDDIEFELIKDCPRFDGVVESNTPTSVTIKFNSFSNSYEVKASTYLIKDQSDFESIAMPTATSKSSTITVEGLQNHKEYFFYARSTADTICDDWTLVLSAYAADSLVRSLPFEDTFESNPYTATYGATPHDWYGYYSELGNKTYPTLNTTASSGTKGVYCYGNGAGKNVYFVSPELAVDKLGRCYLQFDFQSKGSTSYPNKVSAIIVGAVSNVNDIPGTFEPIDTLFISPDQASIWVTHKLELTAYTGKAKHIAFLSSYDYNKELYSSYPYAMHYIDNVLVDLIPSCYDPFDFKLANATDESISISFSHEGAKEYEVIFGLSGFELDSLGLASHVAEYEVKTKKFTGMKVQFDSLYADYYYDAYIRAICAVGDTTDWAYAGSYQTLPSVVSTFPYNNDFSDPLENSKWKSRYSKQRFSFGVDKDSLVADKKNSTDAALYYSADGGQTTVQGSTNVAGFVYRYVNLEKGSYNFSFDWVFPAEPEITTSQFLARTGLFRVLLMPASTKFASNSVTGFITSSGETVSLSWIDPEVGKLPEGWFDLSKRTKLGNKTIGAFYGTDVTLPLEEQWQHQSVDVTIPEEYEGSYMLVFYYYDYEVNTAVDSLNPRLFVVDDLSIIKSECGAVSNIKVTDYTTRTVSLSWNTSDPTLASYDIMFLTEDVDPYRATDAQKAYTGTVSSTSTTITGLTPFTTYYVYMRPTCTGMSLWSSPTVFTTDVEVPDGYTFSFEEEEMLYFPPFTDAHVYEYLGDSTYLNKVSMFHRWIDRSMLDNNNTYQFNKNFHIYYPQIVYDSIISSYTYLVGHTGKRALWFGSRTTGSWLNGATVAMPYAGEFEGKRLIFYMRPFQARRSKSSATANQFVGAYYPYYTSSTVALSKQSRKITVGTMTDPNDASTFVAIDTIQYPYNDADYGTNTYFNTKDPSGDKGWYRAVVSLNGVKGKYVAFRYEHYGTATTDKTLNMYIDDVTIETIPECPAPELMKINSLKESSVEIDYFYEGSTPTTEVMIATDEDFNNVVKVERFTTLPFTVKGLTPLTKYYLKAKVICSDLDESVYSSPLSFETPLAICYDNNFDNEPSHYPANWKHTTGISIYNYIRGTSQINSPGVPSASSSYGWKITQGIFNSGKFSSKHMVATPYSTTSTSTYSMWAISPAFELDTVAEQHLSFDLALTQKGLSTAIDLSQPLDTNFTFAVVIVDDASYTTYKRENMVIWKPTTAKMRADYDLASIPNTGMEYSIDLAKFKGKNIRVLLLFTSRGMDLHIDNFHINTYTTKDYDASTCEFCDFEDNNFFVLSDNLNVGVNKLNKWIFENEDPDTMLTLNLNVDAVSEINLSASICDGDVYNEEGFTGLVQEGIYRRKFTSVGKCDSIVSLALNVVKPQLTTIVDTICFGTTYTFAGQELNRTGMYVDSLISKVTGCDSIVTLLLTVQEIIRTEQYVNICFGETYKFGKQTISETGVYEEMFKTVDGCDSLVKLHATVLPDYRKTVNAVIKEGEEYNANGFKGLKDEGEYTLPLKSVDGCDSTVTLILKVLTDVSKQVSVNICFGDSYVFGSQTITESGEYVEVFKAADGGDSTVILTATVLPDLRQTISATICAGEVYNENGFSNLKETGVYTLPLKSVDGCDSTVTLNLTVLSGDTTYIEKTITTEELPYEYQTIRYDKSTLPGTYVDTIVVKTSGCEEVIIHKLTVTSTGVGVENTSSRDLIMVPNPVAVNGTLYINAEFTSEERNGLLVEVFNAIGQCVYSDRPTVYPIEVSGLAERGMYIVRIIAGDGKSYQGKIIVE